MRLLPVLVVGSLSLLATAASAATTTCSSVAACVLGTNSSSGPGVGGTSKSGFGLSGISTSNHGVNGTSSSSFGVVGITTQPATSPSNARAGVLGEDSSTNKNYYNSGVSGTSTYGAGVYGYSANTDGVLGSSKSVGVCGQSDVSYTTPKTNLCQTSGPVGVSGNSDNGWGLFGYSYQGVGLQGLSNNGTAGAFTNLNDNNPALVVQGGMQNSTPKSGYSIFEVDYVSSPPVFEVDQVGNVTIAGTLQQNDSEKYRTATANGGYVTSYGARESIPTLEDFGQSRLTNGVAYVSLERTFLSTIDARKSYMVFLTPNGNSAGLYVSHKTQSGFEVHENSTGRSSLDFDYRIVAKPANSSGSRLAQDHSVPRRPYQIKMPTIRRNVGLGTPR